MNRVTLEVSKAASFCGLYSCIPLDFLHRVNIALREELRV